MTRDTDKGKNGSLKRLLNVASIVNVEVPDAKQRLQKAIELLLDRIPFSEGINSGETNNNRRPKKQQGSSEEGSD